MSKRLIKIVIGWFFIILGIIGCFLPVLQGFLFIAVGLVLLSDDIPLIKRYLRRLENKYPEQYRKVHEFRDFLHDKFRKMSHRE